MANLKTKLCGIELESPFILGSGPAGFDAESLAACYHAGCGAVVTKSISIDGFVNTSQHMIFNGKDSLLNNEGGSDMPLKQWVDVEIPQAKALGVKVLIASVYGYGSLEETLIVSKQCEKAGADMLEIVSGYSEPGDLAELISAVKEVVDIPVIAKVNGNWKNTDDVALACEKAGADAITAIDSIGPTYRVDIKTGKPLIGGDGYGYLTGANILPIALRFVHDIALKSEKDIIGLGGVTSAETAMEMLMAGGNACGVCSLAIIKGPKIFESLNKKLSDLMDEYGYEDIQSLSRLSLKKEKLEQKSVEDFKFDEGKCIHCNLCIRACAYRARRFKGQSMTVDSKQCRICGLCFGVCPKDAISIR